MAACLKLETQDRQTKAGFPSWKNYQPEGEEMEQELAPFSGSQCEPQGL